MQQTVGSCEKRGIRWTTEKNLEDLDFTDDLCLMSHKLEDLQAKTYKLVEEAAKTGLPSSEHREDRGDEDTAPTTPTTTTNSNHHQREKLKGSSLLHLSTLGSTVSITGSTGTDEDVKVRIGKSARQAFLH
ncbi:unnamed protein product [Heterobilharzia americana]|nr:unnamed protein product [Heterobilharzia americana]